MIDTYTVPAEPLASAGVRMPPGALLDDRVIAHSPESHVTVARRALALIWLRLPLLAGGFAILALARLLLAPHGSGGSTMSWTAWKSAWQWAANHAYVVVSLAADLPGLWLLRRALRAEDRTLRDLVGYARSRLARDLLLGAGVFAIMAVPFAILPMIATAITGAEPYPSGLTRPPLWVALWTIVVFPLTTASTEELLFRGYALPRLRQWVGLPVAVATSAIAFGAAHMLIPPVGYPNTLLARWITLTGIGVLLELLYVRFGRLLPLIVGHAMVDAFLIGGFAIHAAL